MNETVLVRYGAIPEVARFDVAVAEPIQREEAVVVRSHRGVEVGTLLEPVGGNTNAAGSASPHSDEKLVLLRRATPQDHDRAEQLRSECQRQFDEWRRRICDWDLELVDLERTLERTKLILYVLNNRGPDCTRLALQAAAAGLGIVEVQPVGGDGLVRLEPSTGGCSTGGCQGGGCHG